MLCKCKLTPVLITFNGVGGAFQRFFVNIVDRILIRCSDHISYWFLYRSIPFIKRVIHRIILYKTRVFFMRMASESDGAAICMCSALTAQDKVDHLFVSKETRICALNMRSISF